MSLVVYCSLGKFNWEHIVTLWGFPQLINKVCLLLLLLSDVMPHHAAWAPGLPESVLLSMHVNKSLKEATIDVWFSAVGDSHIQTT